MSIYNKLFEAKKEIGKISKDSKNPFFKSKYFDINKLLEHVEPILQDHGLLILQPITSVDVMTEIVDVETSESINSKILLPNITDPQKLGSAITYYRRYTLQSLLALQAEDDDGNNASGSVSTPKISADVKLKRAKALKELVDVWNQLTPAEKEQYLTLKDQLKEKLTPKTS